MDALLNFVFFLYKPLSLHPIHNSTGNNKDLYTYSYSHSYFFVFALFLYTVCCSRCSTIHSCIFAFSDYCFILKSRKSTVRCVILISQMGCFILFVKSIIFWYYTMLMKTKMIKFCMALSCVEKLKVYWFSFFRG